MYHDRRPSQRELDVAVRLEDDLRSGVRESVAIRSVAHARNERTRVVSMAMVLAFQGYCSLFVVRCSALDTVLQKREAEVGGPLEAGPGMIFHHRRSLKK